MSITGDSLNPINELITANNVDLNNCDREQVQYPGSIQPHGFMIVLQEATYQIVQVSSNVSELLGIPPNHLLGQPLAKLLDPLQADSIARNLAKEAFQGAPHHLARLTLAGREFDVLVHRIEASLILEFELRPLAAQVSDTNKNLFPAVHQAISKMSIAPSLQSFFDQAAAQVKSFTGYDRVMVYKFMDDGSGWVCSEALSEGLEPFLGLHYPPTDIPLPARRLFSLTWVRHQPDIGYRPVRMVPELNPMSGRPLDMSYASLRSVSVMYVDYLKNMGTHSSLVMTLMREGKLWGLIACHHHSGPKYVPYEIRGACEILAHMLSLLMSARESEEQADFSLSLKSRHSAFVAAAVSRGDYAIASDTDASTLLQLVRATGAAAFVNGQITCVGQTPETRQILEIITWLNTQPKQAVFSTDCLSSYFPSAQSFAANCAGLIVLCFNNPQNDSFLWFRPEILQTVNWAGDPNKPVDLSDDGQRLMPRTSFALWQETVRWKSEPWLELELAAVKELRNSLLDLVLRKAEEFGRLYQNLKLSYSELDAFAYAASHDLKEPLRGIHAYAEMLLEESAEKLDPASLAKLESVRRLSARMDQLINSLLAYSRIGRESLLNEEVDLNTVLAEALDSLSELSRQRPATIGIMPNLPSFRGDRQRILEVFTNLISNALKYNDKSDRIIEIGVRSIGPSGVPLLFVRDNGIGIPEHHHEDIFRIFHRLHAKDAFGGGNGAGLTIVRKIIDLHGGRIWIESKLSEGTAFLFSFGPLQAGLESE